MLTRVRERIITSKEKLLRNPTTGLVNRVLHENKIGHTVQNATKKAVSTVNKSLRRATKIMLR